MTCYGEHEKGEIEGREKLSTSPSFVRPLQQPQRTLRQARWINKTRFGSKNMIFSHNQISQIQLTSICCFGNRTHTPYFWQKKLRTFFVLSLFRNRYRAALLRRFSLVLLASPRKSQYRRCKHRLRQYSVLYIPCGAGVAWHTAWRWTT